MTTERISVLLVEDDELDADLVKRMLNSVSEVEIAVRHVTTTAETSICISHHHIDVVILDLGLPDSQGFDTVLRVRASFPRTPVVVLTGLEDETIGIQAIECGAQDYISKNVVTGQLLFRAIRFAIARHRQITSYKAQARTDVLTGLANRRAFDAAMSRTLAGWKRTKHPFSLMLLDIDHFKNVNDSHGHLAGDYILASLGEIITTSLRETEFAARIGGEEFAVILPDTQLAYAATAAERLLHEIRSVRFNFEGKSLQITASAGIAEITLQDHGGGLYDRADQALYAAKANGRDRGFVHDGQQSQPAASPSTTETT